MNMQTLISQYTAEIIRAGENEKQRLYQQALIDIAEKANIDIASAEEVFQQALKCVENVRCFTEHLDHVLGNMKTKHGEIAEMLEVEIGNAHDHMQGVFPRWNIDKDAIGRTGAVDYVFIDFNVQSKFCNGANNSLDAILKHLDTYPDFGQKGFYQIPKDQYATIQKILQGDSVGEISAKTANAIKAKIDLVVQKTGKPIEGILHPSRFSYEDVQLGRVDAVLNAEDGRIRNEHTTKIETIHKDASKKIADAEKIVKPSLEESLKYSFISGVISGAAEAGTCIYGKIKSGKKITDFTGSDWKDVVIDFGKGGVKGGASGMSIYWLTKITNSPASIAAAMTSATIGIGSLAVDYKRGKITKDEFIGGAYSLSYETSIVAVGAIVGQIVIPIPVLGAMLGSTISKVAYDLTKNFFEGQENALVKEMEERYNAVEKRMKEDLSNYDNVINVFYKTLNVLISSSEQYDCFALMNSISLCEKLGIDPLTMDTIDTYMGE